MTPQADGLSAARPARAASSAPADPYLLTPGPLTTSARTKRAMLRDWGSWDDDFKAVTADIRTRLVAMAGGEGAYQCVPMQGSGTFAVEAALGSFVPRHGKVLALVNGAYGQRAVRILDYLGRERIVLNKGDYAPPRGPEVEAILKGDPAVTDVFVVHCETSSGILNPLDEIAEVVARCGRRLIVDSMSAFGAVPFDARKLPFDVMVSSANKCIEGVPGFGFVIASNDAFERAAGCSHSLSLDVHDQWDYMERTGQWRFTPPTHTVVAFREALLQHEEEGGVEGRGARYARNRDVLVAGMRALGFETLLEDAWLSPMITTFFSPAHPRFSFERFYDEVKARGFVIYPGKLTKAASFRIGHIGQLDETVMRGVVSAVGEALEAMGVDDCRPERGRSAE